MLYDYSIQNKWSNLQLREQTTFSTYHGFFSEDLFHQLVEGILHGGQQSGVSVGVLDGLGELMQGPAAEVSSHRRHQESEYSQEFHLRDFFGRRKYLVMFGRWQRVLISLGVILINLCVSIVVVFPEFK